MEVTSDRRTYRSSRYLFFGTVAALGVVSVIAIPAILFHGASGGGWIGIALGLGFLGLMWFNAVATVAYRIDVTGEEVTFRCIARRRTTRMSSINSIRCSGFWLGATTIRYGYGNSRVALANPVDGMHDFVARAKAANEDLQLKGV